MFTARPRIRQGRREVYDKLGRWVDLLSTILLKTQTHTVFTPLLNDFDAWYESHEDRPAIIETYVHSKLRPQSEPNNTRDVVDSLDLFLIDRYVGQLYTTIYITNSSPYEDISRWSRLARGPGKVMLAVLAISHYLSPSLRDFQLILDHLKTGEIFRPL
jgi:hypothetical protein